MMKKEKKRVRDLVLLRIRPTDIHVSLSVPVPLLSKSTVHSFLIEGFPSSSCNKEARDLNESSFK